ncbi:MAG TPA: AMP-binding protein [Casimicrobiaceae bacterium]|nr:AMP-binding protein [Casimicrobiaceae bacterium]
MSVLPDTFRAVIDGHASTQPSAPFLLAPEPGIDINYATLRNNCVAFAALLDGLGIASGATVSFMLENGISAASVFLGAMYGGYVVSPINLLAHDAQLEYTLTHSESRLVFTTAANRDRVEAIRERTRAAFEIRIVDIDGIDLRHDAKPRLAPLRAGDPAMLMYTSGTTGMPKGALLSHANMLAAGRAVARSLELGASDRVLSSLPLYHINGQCIATVAPLVSGGSVVMPHRFSVSQWWPLVEKHRPTWLNMVPTIIAYLLNGRPTTADEVAACANVRFGRSASAPLPPEQHRAFEQRFGISVVEAMGLTECASVAFSNPLDAGARRYGSPGFPLGVEARVVDPMGRVLPDNERGEIEIRGDNVMLGYFKAPEATAAALRDGWLATGDLGFRDADGYYFITGRLKELIIKGGENIAPREIDEALLAHPAVLEAAAVGVPDPAYGQDILACVVVKPGASCSEEDLRAHCLRTLGRYKSPRYLRLVDQLPKGPSGKVQRLRLVEL